jgi:hypothetical protein
VKPKGHIGGRDEGHDSGNGQVSAVHADRYAVASGPETPDSALSALAPVPRAVAPEFVEYVRDVWPTAALVDERPGVALAQLVNNDVKPGGSATKR